MLVDRRTMLAGTAAALAIGGLSARAEAAAPPSWFRRAIVIDALGGFGDPDAAEGINRYGDKAWADTLATGVTVVRDTVMPVGNVTVKAVKGGLDVPDPENNDPAVIASAAIAVRIEVA